MDLICSSAPERTYFSDKGLSDEFIPKTRVGEIVVIVVRWGHVSVVTRAANVSWTKRKKGTMI